MHNTPPNGLKPFYKDLIASWVWSTLLTQNHDHNVMKGTLDLVSRLVITDPNNLHFIYTDLLNIDYK